MPQIVEEIEKHMVLLESDGFAERANARIALKKLGGAAIPQLEKKLEGKLSPSEKSALKNIVATLRKASSSPMNPEHQKQLIASRVARIMRISGAATQGLKVTGSDPSYLGALTDGYAADEISNFNEAPKYVWFKSGGGKEGWVQYDYDKERTFTSGEVFWQVSKQNKKTGATLPASWGLSYLDGGQWKPIVVKGSYSITLGKWDKVEFDPIKTKAIRLTAKSQPDAPRMGLLEFRLGEE